MKAVVPVGGTTAEFVPQVAEDLFESRVHVACLRAAAPAQYTEFGK
jgi:hypothetical protein